MADSDSTVTPTPSQPIQFLQGAIEQIPKVQRTLDHMYRELELIQSVTMVCGAALNSHFDKEVELVLRRCASDRLFGLQKVATELAERFGGTTPLSGRDSK